MIIFGRRTIRIKKYNDYNIKCENCGKNHQRFYVYQQYFHVMFIPFFPTSIKTIRCSCAECNDTFNQEKKSDYLSLTKTPIYLYAGGLLIAGLIIFTVIGNLKNQKLKKDYVNNPMIDDVYRIRHDENNTTTYYFLKIDDIKSDTIDLLHGALQYSGFVVSMNDSDYFVKDDILRFLKSDLISYLDSGWINSVERDYEINSRFNIEK